MIITKDPQIDSICEAALPLNRCIDSGCSYLIWKDGNLQSSSILQLHKGFIMLKRFVVMYVSTQTRKIIDEMNRAMMSERGRV